MRPDDLAAAIGCPPARAKKWAPHITAAMARYQINTPARQAAFLAQMGHESGRLVWVCEIWGPTTAQSGYEGRRDLGNTKAGDGKRFMGRGLIQITGRANYERCGKALGLDLIAKPQLLELPINAAMSAAWYWNSRKLNALADAGEFDRITVSINGGQNGREERRALWASALAAMTLSATA